MTITATSLGSYTTQITISGEITSTNIMIALDTAIVTGGYWSQWDISNQYYRVYRSLNIDGISYKYASISMDPWKQRLWISSWENWDIVNHVGTNESFNTYGGYWSGYTFYNCDIVVFAGPRWLGFQTYIRNANNATSSFVVETTREHVQDTAAAGYPCWGLMQPQTMAQPAPFGTGALNSNLFSMPRTRDGFVGQNAARRSFISTPFARISNSGNGLAGQGNNFLSNGLAAALNQVTNAWDSTTNYVYTLRVGHGQSSYQGRIAALKGTKIPGATLLNRISIPVDSNFGYSNDGVSTEHWTLPINIEKLSALTSQIYTPTQSISDMVWNGNTLFYVSSAGLYRMDIGTQIVTTVSLQSGTKVSLCFDGRYIWCLDPSNSRIIKWDTTTDVVTLGPTIPGLLAYRMCYDGSFLWALDLQPVANVITIRKIDPTTLALNSSIVTSTLTSTVKGIDIACDTFGNIAFSLSDSAISNAKMYRISAGTITGLAQISGLSATHTTGSIFWMGGKSFDVIYNSTSVSTFISIVDFSNTTPSIIINSSTNSLVFNSSPAYGVFLNTPRQGRGVFFAAAGTSSVSQIDFESYNSSDSVIINSGFNPSNNMICSGTHVINWSSSTVYISALNTGVTSTNTQLLLPK